MINLNNGQITDILSESTSSKTEIQCLSYALKKAQERFLSIADSTMIYAAIDSMPASMLDLLAIELRCPYYDDTMVIEVKRSLVKQALVLRTKGGTKAAVENLLRMIFGDGTVTEWFDYTEAPYTPGTFDISVFARTTELNVDYFNSIIEEVKNIRSHIRHVSLSRPITLTVKAGAGIISRSSVAILN